METTTRCKSQATIGTSCTTCGPVVITCELIQGHDGLHMASVQRYCPSMREGTMTWAGDQEARLVTQPAVYHDGDLPSQTWSHLVARRADAWLPANGGTEVGFRTRTGRRLLYVFNPALQQHRYLDLDTDLVLEHDEAARALDT